MLSLLHLFERKLLFMHIREELHSESVIGLTIEKNVKICHRK